MGASLETGSGGPQLRAQGTWVLDLVLSVCTRWTGTSPAPLQAALPSSLSRPEASVSYMASGNPHLFQPLLQSDYEGVL